MAFKGEYNDNKRSGTWEFFHQNGNKSAEETIFHEELHQLHLQNVARFFVHYVYSKTNVEGELFGRIDKSAVNYILKNKHSENKTQCRRSYNICRTIL